MDEETYEQFALPRTDVAEALVYMQPSSTVQMLAVDGKPSGVRLPASVELTVSETQPGVKGDTVSNVTKPATLETGATVQVPLFVTRAIGSRSTRARAATSRAPEPGWRRSDAASLDERQCQGHAPPRLGPGAGCRRPLGGHDRP